MRVPQYKWRWFGEARHLIVSQDCRFHLATEVGDFLVSTVGQYVPGESVREILAKSKGVALEGRGDARLADYMGKVGYEDIGCDRKYETMVFRLSAELCDCPEKCGQRKVADWSELESAGANGVAEATENHMRLCRRAAIGDIKYEEPSNEESD